MPSFSEPKHTVGMFVIQMRSEQKRENSLRYSKFFSKIYTQQGWVWIITQKGTEIISHLVLASFHLLLNLLKNCFGLFCFKHQRRCFLYAHLGYFQPSKYSEIQAIQNRSFFDHPHKSSHNKIIALLPAGDRLQKMSSDTEEIMTKNGA